MLAWVGERRGLEIFASACRTLIESLDIDRVSHVELLTFLMDPLGATIAPNPFGSVPILHSTSFRGATCKKRGTRKHLIGHVNVMTIAAVHFLSISCSTPMTKHSWYSGTLNFWIRMGPNMQGSVLMKNCTLGIQPSRQLVLLGLSQFEQRAPLSCIQVLVE